MPVVFEEPPAMTETEMYAELNAIANRSAFILAIDDETLAAWFLKQVGWWGNHANKLGAAREKAGNSFSGCELTVRLENAVETIVLLKERQHVLCCREHGVQGVTPDEFEDLPLDVPGNVKTPEFVYAALADRGVFEGDWAGWERACERCLQGQIKREAERRFRGGQE